MIFFTSVSKTYADGCTLICLALNVVVLILFVMGCKIIRYSSGLKTIDHCNINAGAKLLLKRIIH